MTAPIWMASPPELHSALLSSGPGPASLLAAAGAWSDLSAEYATTAAQLSALLTEVQAGAWQGPSAASYAAAHVPYLEWLTQSSADSAVAAAQHEVAATAYATALAAMPTLPELATNRVVHGTLVATNFFGMNTIPIAVNEADYARMWVQAATTMSTYQAVSTAAVASTPQADPAPQIVKADAASDDSDDDGGNPFPDPTIDNPFNEFLARLLRNLGIDWNPAQGTVNGMTYDSYTNAGQPIFWVVRALELLEDFEQFFYYLVHNPALAFQYLVSLELFDWPTHIAEIASWLITQPELLVPVLIISAAPLGAVGGLAGLVALAAIPSAPAVAPPVVPAPPLPAALPLLGSTPLAAPAVAPAAPTPAPTPAPTTVTSVATPAAPPAAAGPGFFPPYVVGPPRLGASSGIGASASSSAKRKAPEPDSAAAAAAAAARGASRAKRRQRARQRDYGDEFMDMNVDVSPDWGGPPADGAASHRGAGALGFAGTARREGAATGLITLEGDEFGGGPATPMMPTTWDVTDDER